MKLCCWPRRRRSPHRASTPASRPWLRFASLVGQTGGYLLGRGLGWRVRSGRVGRWVGAPNWARAERLLRGGTGRALIGSRFLAVAHSLVPVVAGCLRMPARRFGRYTALGAVLWALVYVGVGSAASVAIRSSAHLIGPTATALVVVTVGVAVLVGVVRRRRARRKSGSAGAPARTPTRRP